MIYASYRVWLVAPNAVAQLGPPERGVAVHAPENVHLLVEEVEAIATTESNTKMDTCVGVPTPAPNPSDLSVPASGAPTPPR